MKLQIYPRHLIHSLLVLCLFLVPLNFLVLSVLGWWVGVLQGWGERAGRPGQWLHGPSVQQRAGLPQGFRALVSAPPPAAAALAPTISLGWTQAGGSEEGCWESQT